MDDVAQQWADDPDVTEMTDTDLVASRRDNSNVSDPSQKLHRLLQTVRNGYDYPDTSWTLDTALRVELARLIDTDSVSFGHEDFDVRYTIPPTGWVKQQRFEKLPVVNEEELDLTDRAYNFSSPPVVMWMADRVVDEGIYSSVSDTVKAGLQVLAGRQNNPPRATVMQTSETTAQNESAPEIAILQLFKTGTQRRIIEYALYEMDDKQWYRTGEISAKIDITHNVVADAIQPKEGFIGPMIRFGVIEPKHNPMTMPNIPHYRPADTVVMDLLSSWDGYPLTELFESEMAQKLVPFFLFRGDNKAWSVNQIRHEGSFSFSPVANQIGLLVECNLLTTEEKPRTTAYRLNTDSEIYQFFGQLNDAVLDVAEEHEDKYLNSTS